MGTEEAIVGFWPWAERNAGFFGLLSLLLAAWAIWTVRYGGFSLREQLEERDSWPELIRRCECTLSDAYFNGLNRVLMFGETFYGPRVSWQSFNRCVQLALVYPVLWLLIGWVVFGTNTFGQLQVFSLQPSGFLRLRDAVGILATALIVGYLWAHVDQSKSSKPRISQWLISGSFVAASIFAAYVGTGVFVSAFAGEAILALEIRWLAGFTIAIGVIVVVAAIPSEKIASALGGSFVVGAIVIVSSVLNKTPEFASIWLLLFFAIPLVNAFTDWLSLSATRWFLNKVVGPPRSSLGFILLQVFADLFIAVACLVLLLVGIVFLLWLWSSIVPGSLLFDWQVYWADAMADWRNAMALWLMLGTTLLPTAVHLMAGLGAVFTARSRMLLRVAMDLKTAISTEQEKLTKSQINALVRRKSWADAIGLFLACMTMGSLAWLVFQALHQLL